MANEWNTSYPIDHTLISDVPGKIRKLKASAKTQLDMEHEAPVDGDATGSEHSNGSAVAYQGSSTPTNRPNGTTGLGDNSIDKGRLWLDDNTDPPTLKRWDGSAFEIPITISFGTRTNLDSASGTLVKDGVYKVGSDGHITAHVKPTGGSKYLRGYTDGNNPPTTLINRQEVSFAEIFALGISFPVRKDDYFEITASEGAPAIYWLPIGTGECVKQV